MKRKTATKGLIANTCLSGRSFEFQATTKWTESKYFTGFDLKTLSMYVCINNSAPRWSQDNPAPLIVRGPHTNPDTIALLHRAQLVTIAEEQKRWMGTWQSNKPGSLPPVGSDQRSDHGHGQSPPPSPPADNCVCPKQLPVQAQPFAIWTLDPSQCQNLGRTGIATGLTNIHNNSFCCNDWIQTGCPWKTALQLCSLTKISPGPNNYSQKCLRIGWNTASVYNFIVTFTLFQIACRGLCFVLCRS